MPIPPFDHNGVVPPHLGNPALPDQLSPYPTTLVELCQTLGTTADRRTILAGLLGLRAILRQLGLVDGFQWLDGSFMEDVESAENRSPGDIDVVTFVTYPPHPAFIQAGAPGEVLANRTAVRNQFRVDHQVVNLGWSTTAIVEHTRYWTGLFSHSRTNGVWKGMLKVELDAAADDAHAAQILAAANAP